MSKEKNPKLKNVRVIYYLNYLIFLGTLTFFSASCAKEEKGDEINKNQQIEGQKTKRSSEAFNKNNELWSTLDDPVKDCLLYTSPSPRDQRGSGMGAGA